MPQFVIEREITNAGSLSAIQLRNLSKRSCDAVRKLRPAIHWVRSYVTHDRLYCVYIAASEDIVREHARLGGFPVHRISQVREILDPSTAE